MDKTIMKNEAIRRMKKLGLMNEVIKIFKNENRIYYSERKNKMFPAVLYWLDNKPEYIKLKDEFEKKYGSIVYHAILTHTIFGDILDFLYVSKYEEEWEMDNIDIDEKYPLVYSNNLLDDTCSEFGAIAIEPAIGGLVRIG